MIRIPNAPYEVELYATIGGSRDEHYGLLPLQYYGPFEEEPGVVFIALRDAAWLTNETLQELHEWASQNWTADQLGRLYRGRNQEQPQSKNPSPKQVSRSGYVYLIKGRDYYKIGHSVDPNTRLGQLIGILLPHKLELIHTIKTKDMYALEDSLHKHFSEKRLEGEWFELDDLDVDLLKTLDYVKGALSEEGIAIIIQEEMGGHGHTTIIERCSK